MSPFIRGEGVRSLRRERGSSPVPLYTGSRLYEMRSGEFRGFAETCVARVISTPKRAAGIRATAQLASRRAGTRTNRRRAPDVRARRASLRGRCAPAAPATAGAAGGIRDRVEHCIQPFVARRGGLRVPNRKAVCEPRPTHPSRPRRTSRLCCRGQWPSAATISIAVASSRSRVRRPSRSPGHRAPSRAPPSRPAHQGARPRARVPRAAARCSRSR